MRQFTTEEIDTRIDAADLLLSQAEGMQSNDLNGLSDFLMNLISILSLSTDVVASAKYHYTTIKRARYAAYTEYYKGQGKPLPPSIVKEIAECELADEIHRLSKAERQNAAITHSIDAIRTLISKGKAELEYNKFTK